MPNCRCLSLLLLVLAGTALPVQGEIYRWVDEQGKVHFSDRKPDHGQAEDVSGQLKPTNIDSSQQEQEKLGKIFARETDAEKQARERAAVEASNKQKQRDYYCQKLQRAIAILTGPVYWSSDANGQARDMSLEEQQAELHKAQTAYNQRCR